MTSLWGEMRGHYQKDGLTDEDALSVAIAKRIQISPGEVRLPRIMHEDVLLSPEQIAAIPATGPTR